MIQNWVHLRDELALLNQDLLREYVAALRRVNKAS